MNVARPYSAVCQSLESDVLNVLAGTSRPLTGREVARLAGRKSHSGVLGALIRLHEHGLVDRQEAGRALLFTLNREHLAAPAVIVLAGMRRELIERLQQTMERWALTPVHASMFGSAARGDGDTQSDIDLFIVRPRDVDDHDFVWREQLDDLVVSVRHWTGNHAAVSEVGETEMSQLRKSGRPIVTELRNDGIRLCGPDISQLFGVAQ
jgi:predicted nucleotidyltransferase